MPLLREVPWKSFSTDSFFTCFTCNHNLHVFSVGCTVIMFKVRRKRLKLFPNFLPSCGLYFDVLISSYCLLSSFSLLQIIMLRTTIKMLRCINYVIFSLVKLCYIFPSQGFLTHTALHWQLTSENMLRFKWA